ncbi:hypothetical protein GDO81_014707 [Engystomops pustulosus]|uniref:G-protein coupled receptors family 1 profile domain-containing protein n=1 Tax=Engystomops pustulosus TaxID=76066 RepID=A0AAV7BC67_ENGPU|nr:hypothetical protein GDO81_014707 [Engystomops pustulosus]
MKKTISAVWFLNLAIANFLFCASLPLPIYGLASPHDVCSSSFSNIFCLLIRQLFCLNMSASVLLLTAMSIDRWVSVMWPFWAQVHRTQNLVRITAGIIWVMSLFWFVLIYLSLLDTIDRIFRYYIYLSVFLFWVVILCLIPFLIIFTSYVTIFIKLRKSNRPQRSQRPYRIITAVILCFFICWAPYYIHKLIPINYESEIQYLIVDVIVFILACLNSCINPIIYVFMGQDFGHSFLRSIPFRVENALSEDPGDPCGEQEDPECTPSTDVP